MGRGPNRKKIIVERKLDANHSVCAKVWLDTRTVDISVPDRSPRAKMRLEFRLRHFKDIPLADARALYDALDELAMSGALGDVVGMNPEDR